jgi:hypothetical protein
MKLGREKQMKKHQIKRLKYSESIKDFQEKVMENKMKQQHKQENLEVDYQTLSDKALEEEIEAEFQFDANDNLVSKDPMDISYPSYDDNDPQGPWTKSGDPWSRSENKPNGAVAPVGKTIYTYPSYTDYKYPGAISTYKPHEPHKETFVTIKGVKVAGMAKHNIVNFKGLLINCTGTATLQPKALVKATLPQLKFLTDDKYIILPEYEELVLDWPDRDAINLTPQFWIDLVSYVFTDSKYPRVNVCCVGGHGRTGTALACMILAAMHLDYPINGNKGMVKKPDKLIKWIREQYCPDAIEGQFQQEYIEDIHHSLK